MGSKFAATAVDSEVFLLPEERASMSKRRGIPGATLVGRHVDRIHRAGPLQRGLEPLTTSICK